MRAAGEAATAAGQAELHAGEDLIGPVSDLALGAWPRVGLSCTRRSGTRPVLEMSCGERSGELRVGAALIDLAAGEEEPAVTTTTDVLVTSLLDEALLAAASATGTTVAAMRATPRGPYVVHLASRDGDLARGLVDPVAVSALPGLGGLSRFDGLIVLTGVPVVELVRTQLAGSSVVERAEQRRDAALYGIEVDPATWRVVAEQAQLFLVPERDA